MFLGAKTTLSLVLAWHFPDRDFSHIILGNMYTELWKNSAAVAEELATESKLTSVVADINAHHYSVASPDNPTPVWLKDQLLNQWSHFHMLMWYKDGRLREYEAWSCDDVDSVHNDYQRHLLYLWAYPEFELNKMEAWSTFAQDPKDGHIWESLGYTGKPMDQGGGRLMGDTTSLYLLEMYELLRHNGNKTFIQEQWPSAKRAVDWMIGNANATYGLPQRLATTYDHFGFHTHTTVTYNAHIYLTALAAVEAMATDVMQDTATVTACAKASALAKAKLIAPTSAGGPLWDGDKKFWHAHSDTATQIFTDTLYGQMLAHHHLQNYTLPMEMLEQHLAYEW